ncbi:hypothetical protein PFISCL1PPCAC_14393 [Pristionchus fissidentatus]|uniref:Uncharacterized protein n=1 Tax=Pristionchus fissidentatus TaxID=1538716 RepID=A0AAV5VUD1_9BILA|nr:hypothetical protein PFISCL1PPCAC_14393 [Pristionchus fissidentatus]
MHVDGGDVGKACNNYGIGMSVLAGILTVLHSVSYALHITMFKSFRAYRHQILAELQNRNEARHGPLSLSDLNAREYGLITPPKLPTYEEVIDSPPPPTYDGPASVEIQDSISIELN